MRSNDDGGCSNECVPSVPSRPAGGVEGGVSSCERKAGRGPGEQKGICLLGTGAGAPVRGAVLSESCGGGVVVLSLTGVGRASSVAMMRSGSFENLGQAGLVRTLGRWGSRSQAATSSLTQRDGDGDGRSDGVEAVARVRLACQE